MCYTDIIAVIGLALAFVFAGVLLVKIQVVHRLVNSRASEQDNTIRALNAANETLREANLNLERSTRAFQAPPASPASNA
jgi:hypothetical protein